MPIAAPIANPATSPPDGGRGHIVLEGVSFDAYQSLVEQTFRAGQRLRMTFDGDRLEIMTTSFEHEFWKGVIWRLVHLLSLELNIPLTSAGSVTFSRRDLAMGLEPDECYFIQHAEEVRGIKRWDSARHPPPDLAIEVDVTSGSIPRLPIYAALEVPEVWRFKSMDLTCLGLDQGGDYRPMRTSRVFPFLEPKELEPFLQMLPRSDELEMERAFQRWLRERYGNRS